MRRHHARVGSGACAERDGGGDGEEGARDQVADGNYRSLPPTPTGVVSSASIEV